MSIFSLQNSNKEKKIPFNSIYSLAIKCRAFDTELQLKQFKAKRQENRRQKDIEFYEERITTVEDDS